MCRKADWIDATKGWCRKGIRRSAIAMVESTWADVVLLELDDVV